MQRIIFITGAAGGIGLEMAKTFLQNGDYVFVSDFDETKIGTAVAALQQVSPKVEGCLLDVTNEAAVQAVFSSILQQYTRIDVLINNAGLQYVSEF